MRGHASAVPPKAFSKRIAISAEIAALPLTTLDSVGRAIFNASAPVVTLRPNGSRHVLRINRPGCGDFTAVELAHPTFSLQQVQEVLELLGLAM